MKRTLLVLMSILLAGSLSLFAQGTSEKQVEKKAQVITVFHHMSEQSKRDGLDNLIALFSEKHPEVIVEVEATDFSNFSATLKTKIAAGDAPDIIFGRPKGYMELVEAGQIADLSDEAFLSQIADTALSSMKVDGKVYGLPMDVQSMGVFYNKELFAANGWQVPETYSELIALCKEIQQAGITPFAFGFKDAWTAQVVFQSDFSGYPLSSIPDFYRDTASREKRFVDYPELIDSFARYAERLQYGSKDPFSIDYSRQLAMVATGEAAMVMQGNWSVGDIRRANPEGDFGYFLNPSSDEKEKNLLNIAVDDAFMVSSQSTNRDLVSSFLEVFASPEGAKTWAETAKVIPVVKNVQLDELDQMLKDIQSYIEKGQTYNFESRDVYSGQYNQTFRQYQEEFAVSENKDPLDFARKLDAEFDKIKATE